MIVAAAGVLLGTLYSFSPLAAVFALWMAVLVWWAVRGTDGRERTWIAGALIAAIAIRAIAVAILPFTAGGSAQQFASYFGDGVYAIQRSIWIRDVFVGVPIAPRDFFEAFEPVFGYSGYNYALAYVQVLFGPSPYGLALVSAGIFMTAAVLLFRRCRSAFGPLAAFIGLAALVFFPTWIAWSVAPLKDPVQLLLLAVAVEAAVVVCRGGTASRIVAAAACAAALWMSATLRNGAEAIAVGGLACGVVAYVGTRRWWVAVAVAALLPLIAWRVVEYKPVRDRLDAVLLQAVRRHVGHAFSPGASYRLLEPRFYMIRDFNEPITIHPDEAVRFLGRAPIGLLMEPRPWAPPSREWIAFAPEQMLWYALLVLAAFGVATGGRRDALLTSLFVGVIAAAVAVIAPNSGNIGTAIRHRDLLTPFLAFLAGAGAQAIANRVMQAGEAAG